MYVDSSLRVDRVIGTDPADVFDFVAKLVAFVSSELFEEKWRGTRL
jgi:hypothetical protein